MTKPKPRIPTKDLIRRLLLMADAGGMLTRDRIDAIRQAASRLQELYDYDKNIQEQEANGE